jgi:NDP-sugar pyrophosphorylase family protein
MLAKHIKAGHWIAMDTFNALEEAARDLLKKYREKSPKKGPE